MKLLRLGYNRGDDETAFTIRLSLKKDEKKFLERAAVARRMETANGKPALALVVASLVRQGLRCIRDHSAEEDPETPFDEVNAFQSGLSIVGPKP